MESGRTRRWRGLAIAAFAATAFLPVHSCGPAPRSEGARAAAPAPAKRVATASAVRSPATSPPRPAAPGSPPPRPPEEQVPVVELRERLASGWAEGGLLRAVWRSRAYYPYLLIPFWVAALSVSATGRARARRAAGVAAVAVAVAVVVLEWHYIRAEYSGLLPARWHSIEVAVAWTTVAAILFVRRPGRAFFDAEAAVSGQALLAGLHGMTFPVADVRTWASAGASPRALLSAILSNYPWPFWVAVGATFAAALPGYAALPRSCAARSDEPPLVPAEASAAHGAPVPPEGG